MLQSNNNCVFNLKFHLVWCVKYREKVLIGDLETRLKEIIFDYAEKFKIDIIEMETDLDHIHILFSSSPTINLTKLIQSFKGGSSFILKKEFPEIKQNFKNGFWSPSYFIATCSDDNKRNSRNSIEEYIRNQKTKRRNKENL